MKTLNQRSELENEIKKLELAIYRLEEKVNSIQRVEEIAGNAYSIATDSEDKAIDAHRVAEITARDMEDLEERLKWSIGLLAPFIMVVVTKIYS